MAIVAAVLSGFVGFLVGNVQVVFFDASLGQGFATYMVVSVLMFGVICLSAWSAAVVPRSKQRDGASEQEELQQWEDWRRQEDLETAELAAWQDAFEAEKTASQKRRSA